MRYHHRAEYPTWASTFSPRTTPSRTIWPAQEGKQQRRTALSKTIEAADGTLESLYYAFGNCELYGDRMHTVTSTISP